MVPAEKEIQMRKIAFIDRDGTLIVEPPETFQVNSLDEMVFLPGVISALKKIQNAGYELVIITNQDNLGTSLNPTDNFENINRKMFEVFASEEIFFKDMLICPHTPEENCECRKPKSLLIDNYLNGEVIDSDSCVIGDRDSDLQLAEKLGIRGYKLEDKTDWKKIADSVTRPMLIRACLQGLQPYDAAVPSGTLLNANENPTDIFSAIGANRYSEGQPALLKKQLSELYGANPEELVITNGSDQGIDLLTRIFLDPGDFIIITPPTFSMYRQSAKAQDAKIISVPLLPDGHQMDVQAIIEAQSKTNAKLIFIPNPSAPLGHEINRDDILTLLHAFKDKAIVVVDEAYIEFSGLDSFVKYCAQFPNLVVLRTLSKYYAMAGLRIGSLIADKKIADCVKSVMLPYPLSASSVRIAQEALSNQKLANEQCVNLMEIKKEMELEIAKLPYVRKIMQTLANFIFLIADDADGLTEFLADNGILVRNWNKQISGGVRISIGTDEENKRLLALMKEWGAK